MGCPTELPRRELDAGPQDVGDPADGGGTDTGVPGDVPATIDVPSVEDAPVSTDDATLGSSTVPNLLSCGASVSASITLTNTGTSTWAPGEVALVASGTDPFGATRLELASAVDPGGAATFSLTGTAPAAGGAYVSAWRLMRGTAAFGPAVTRPIAVNCPGVDSIDLGSVVVHTSPPSFASWPITAQITALDIAPTGGVGSGGIVPSHTRMEGPERWPDVTFLGSTGTIYFTLWFALNIGGTWHVAGAQQYWYEPGLRMCGIPSGWTTNIFYDAGRWGEMSGYPIAEGEIIGVFVASGDHRSRTDEAGSTVLERSPVVLFPFPGDAATTYGF